MKISARKSRKAPARRPKHEFPSIHRDTAASRYGLPSVHESIQAVPKPKWRYFAHKSADYCGTLHDYVPQGYGHSIENVGNKAARVLVAFNSGTYEEIDLTEWMAGNPPDVLATNFGEPASLFEKFPRRDVFIAG